MTGQCDPRHYGEPTRSFKAGLLHAGHSANGGTHFALAKVAMLVHDDVLAFTAVNGGGPRASVAHVRVAGIQRRTQRHQQHVRHIKRAQQLVRQRAEPGARKGCSEDQASRSGYGRPLMSSRVRSVEQRIYVRMCGDYRWLKFGATRPKSINPK